MDEWSDYFEQLFQAGEEQEAQEPELCDRMFREAAAGDVAYQEAAGLGVNVTEEEVCKAMGMLSRGKSAGVDGITAEFIREAWVLGDGGERVQVLLDTIVRLFNRVLQEGYPERWRVGVVCPVPKKPGATDKDDFRGIVVGNAVAKLYSMVLLARLDAWAERCRVRARGQFGFRTGKGTEDATFLLHHAVEMYKKKGQPVYAVFVDFKKAYDSVVRDKLWGCLAGLGVRGRMLEALKSMYAQVLLRVRAGGQLGREFQSSRGVKQGDPLSPLLFGLLLERIETVFDEQLQGGVWIGGQLVKMFMYADDLVILGASPEDIQQSLDLLASCCVGLQMTVNVRKTVGVVFNAKCHRGRPVRWRFAGGRVEIRDGFAYLGTYMDKDKGLEGVWEERQRSAERAMYGMARRCGELGVESVDLQLCLFQALVRSVLDFGAAVWGPKAIQKKGVCKQSEEMHLGFLKRCLGVKDTVSGVAVYQELGLGPLWVGWVRRAAGFWNRVVQRDAADLVRRAMAESCSTAGASWASELERGVQRLACGLEEAWRLDMAGLTKLPVVLVQGGNKEWWRLGLDEKGRQKLARERAGPGSREVRDVPPTERDGFKEYTYRRWFGRGMGGASGSVRFWQCLNRKVAVREVARLVLGSHHLRIEDGRQQRLARSQRLCEHCNHGVIEDERHFIFECDCYEQIRARFGDLFPHGSMIRSDADMNKWMNPDNEGAVTFWRRFYLFVRECWACREAHVLVRAAG
jgi:sorting nexin-29